VKAIVFKINAVFCFQLIEIFQKSFDKYYRSTNPLLYQVRMHFTEMWLLKWCYSFIHSFIHSLFIYFFLEQI